ncbi:hypothetical protein [Mesorhizobium amorphae]
MSDLIDTLLHTPRRLSKDERTKLRKLISSDDALKRFSASVSTILNDAKDENDGHALEDFFIFGAEIHDIVRGPLPLNINAITMAVAAFVYGFTQEPFDHLFKQETLREITDHLLSSPGTRQSESIQVRPLKNKSVILQGTHH